MTMMDEFKQGIEDAKVFIDNNLHLLKAGRWEYRNFCIRECNTGKCPVLFVAYKKGIEDGACEDWWTVNYALNLSYDGARTLASVADTPSTSVPDEDYQNEYIKLRMLLLDKLDPTVNERYGVYNEE